MAERRLENLSGITTAFAAFGADAERVPDMPQAGGSIGDRKADLAVSYPFA